MNKISIIIPAYNAVRTIARTVHSVLASTLPVDVLVVDDGSEDGTDELLNSLIQSKAFRTTSTLRVLHQSNSGAYRARLRALKEISTPYFGFVDADDIVEPTMFMSMIEFAENNELDVVQCGHYDADGVSNFGQDRQILRNHHEVYEKYVYSQLIEAKESCFLWDKIYRNQYNFDEFDLTDNVTNFDDVIFNLKFFMSVNRMGFLNEPLYHYSRTPGSAVHSFNASKVKDFKEACRMRRKLLKEYGISADGAENKRWVRHNRMNCIKAAVLASNLSVCEKIRLISELVTVCP